MERLKSFILELSVVILVFFIVCVAGLVDIKVGESPKDNQRIKEINVVLESDKKDIEGLSAKIEKQHQELQQIKAQMEKLKARGNTEEWNKLVVQYNNKLIQYNKDLSEYKQKLEEYDKRYSSFKSQDTTNQSVVEWVKSVLGI